MTRKVPENCLEFNKEEMQWEREAKSSLISFNIDRIRFSLSSFTERSRYFAFMSNIEFHEWETFWSVKRMITHLPQTHGSLMKITGMCSSIFTLRNWHTVFRLCVNLSFSISTFYFRFITSGKIISLWRWVLNSFMQTPCRYIHFSLKFITREQKYIPFIQWFPHRSCSSVQN